MSKPVKERLWIAAVATVAILLTLACLVWLSTVTRPYDIRPPARQLTPEEKRIFAERFIYHGIEAAVCEGGQCYFYRGGKRHPL